MIKGITLKIVGLFLGARMLRIEELKRELLYTGVFTKIMKNGLQ